MGQMTDETRIDAANKLIEAICGPDTAHPEVDVSDHDIIHEIDMDEHDVYYPGLVLTFKSAETQSRFVAIARKLFAKTKGAHAEDGIIKPDYLHAIKRLPWTTESRTVEDENGTYTADRKTYPLRITDAALAVLATTANIRKITKEYTPIEPEAPAEGPERKVIEFASIKDRGKRGEVPGR